MKITIDTKNDIIKIGGKPIDKAKEHKKEEFESFIREYLLKNTMLSEYETDCMWMSYRYCIGRHTIAANMQAAAIWKHCRGRMPKERELFTAFDINREIEQHLGFISPNFYFPITSLNRIYTTALDIVFEFIEDYEIKSIDDLLKYKDVHVILADNKRGYKLEVITWDEWLKPNVIEIVQKYMNATSDEAWEIFEKWRDSGTCFNDLKKEFEKLVEGIPDSKHYYLFDFEDLIIWNDLVHCFDHEHHHKSILQDGSEREWFWSWTKKTEQREDGKYYWTFGYTKIRVPLDVWNGVTTTWIPDDAIKKDLY